MADIEARNDDCKKDLSNQARMFWYLYKRAVQAFREGDKAECRRQSLEIIQKACLPIALRCSTYHLLSCCTSRSQAENWLDLALEVISDMEDPEGKEEGEIDNEETAYLRRKNTAYRQLLFGGKSKMGDTDDESLSKMPPSSEATGVLTSDTPTTSTLPTSSGLDTSGEATKYELPYRSDPADLYAPRSSPPLEGPASTTRAGQAGALPTPAPTSPQLHPDAMQHQKKSHDGEEPEGGGALTRVSSSADDVL